MGNYMSFMYDRKNEYNCDACPENHGASDWGGNKPCGQQNCWVTVHCDNSERSEI